MPRTIIAGDAGVAYTNTTGVTLFQLIVNWDHSCGLCIQYDHQVGSYWPVPFHRRCRCRNEPLLPDATARPFVDYRAKILTVSSAQQAAIMGRANLALVEAGTVKWDDVVTTGRIRSLREVVSRNKLTVEVMVRAGVSRHWAIEAYDAVHTGTHTAAEVRRQAQIDALLNQGYTKDQVRSATAGALAERLGIAKGPSGPSVILPVPLTPRLARVAAAVASAIHGIFRLLSIPLQPEGKTP